MRLARVFCFWLLCLSGYMVGCALGRARCRGHRWTCCRSDRVDSNEVESVRVGGGSREVFVSCCVCVVVLLFCSRHKKVDLDERGKQRRGLEKCWCPFVIWPGSWSGPSLLCLGRPGPGAAWLLAALAVWCLLLWSGDGGFGGQGPRRGDTRGVGGGRRERRTGLDGHWSGAGSGLARHERGQLVGR